MTEAEWLTCTAPRPMLEFLRGWGSDRKLRLFALACCHGVWDHITDERSRAAVEFAERNAEVGISRRKGRPAVYKAARDACRDASAAPKVVDEDATRVALALLWGNAWESALAALVNSERVAESGAMWRHTPSKRFDWEQQAHLLRDIFGNPFRAATIDPAWLTPEVVQQARTVYDGRSFEQLHVVADALEAVGCTDATILEHCRRPEAGHVRGCWVVDLAIGRR